MFQETLFTTRGETIDGTRGCLIELKRPFESGASAAFTRNTLCKDLKKMMKERQRDH